MARGLRNTSPRTETKRRHRQSTSTPMVLSLYFRYYRLIVIAMHLHDVDCAIFLDDQSVTATVYRMSDKSISLVCEFTRSVERCFFERPDKYLLSFHAGVGNAKYTHLSMAPHLLPLFFPRSSFAGHSFHSTTIQLHR